MAAEARVTSAHSTCGGSMRALIVLEAFFV
jgi:hypothetical protein